jgi:Ca2+-binding RTX toxin-like protein
VGDDHLVDGGPGRDTLDLGFVAPQGSHWVIVALAPGSGEGTLAAGASIFGSPTVGSVKAIERVYGHPGNDYLGGADYPVVFRGLGGDDRLEGSDGDDRLFGNAGADDISGGKGDDHIVGGVGDDNLYGGDGTDHIDGGPGGDYCLYGEWYKSCQW